MVKKINNISNIDPKERFNSLALEYNQYRPTYPNEVFKFFVSDLELNPQLTIADIGVGTGKFTENLLSRGNKVYGVEPNQEMREEAERNLKHYPLFVSVNGSAEETQLPTASVNIVTAAQSFHWFDQEKAKAEFQRILTPHSQSHPHQGIVILLWNIRSVDYSPFATEIEQLLINFGIDYLTIKDSHTPSEAKLQFFFGSQNFQEKFFFHEQKLNLESLKGLLSSYSYMPHKDHPHFNKMTKVIKKIFEKYEKQGYISMPYETKVIWGNLL